MLCGLVALTDATRLRGLPEASTPLRLSLASNSLCAVENGGCAGFVALCEMIGSLGLPALEGLDLSNNNLHYHGGSEPAMAFKKAVSAGGLRRLRSLNLAENRCV